MKTKTAKPVSWGRSPLLLYSLTQTPLFEINIKSLIAYLLMNLSSHKLGI